MIFQTRRGGGECCVGFFHVIFLLIAQDKTGLSPEQTWQRSENNEDGYFTLKNPASSLFLVSTEVPGVLSAWKDPSQYVSLLIKGTYGTDQSWQKQIKGDLIGECDGWIKLKLEDRQFQLSDMFLELSISGEDLSIQVEGTIQLFMIHDF